MNDATFHQGILPVRVLMEKMLLWFENVSDDFLEELVDEISYRGLSSRIACIPATGPIKTPCLIRHTQGPDGTELQEIEIEEAFLQYLWCNAYAMLILYHQGVETYRTSAGTDGKLNADNPSVVKALRVSECGSFLFKKLDSALYFEIPNPENTDHEDQSIINIVNEVYASAAAFCLIHEVGHQYYGHLGYSPDDLVKQSEEFLADEYAAEKFRCGLNLNDHRDFAICAGAVVAMLSILHLDGELRGDSEHPYPDERVIRVLDHLGRKVDDPMWALAAFGLPIWSALHKGPKDLGSGNRVSSYRELFISALESIAASRA